MLCYCSKTKR